jgi:hypothetical protein
MAERLTAGEQWADMVAAQHAWDSSRADSNDFGHDVAPTMWDIAFEEHPGAEGIKALEERGLVAISGRRIVDGVDCTAIFVDRLGPNGEKTEYTLEAEWAFQTGRTVDTEA